MGESRAYPYPPFTLHDRSPRPSSEEDSTMHHDERHRAPARLIGSVLAALMLVAATAPTAGAMPLKCRRTISKASAVFVQNQLKASQRCEDAILRGKFAGPCPDQKATAKVVKL